MYFLNRYLKIFPIFAWPLFTSNSTAMSMSITNKQSSLLVIGRKTMFLNAFYVSASAEKTCIIFTNTSFQHIQQTAVFKPWRTADSDNWKVILLKIQSKKTFSNLACFLWYQFPVAFIIIHAAYNLKSLGVQGTQNKQY